MEFDVKTLNQIISDFEDSGGISGVELDRLESAALSGAAQRLNPKGLPLLGMRAKTKER